MYTTFGEKKHKQVSLYFVCVCVRVCACVWLIGFAYILEAESLLLLKIALKVGVLLKLLNLWLFLASLHPRIWIQAPWQHLLLLPEELPCIVKLTEVSFAWVTTYPTLLGNSFSYYIRSQVYKKLYACLDTYTMHASYGYMYITVTKPVCKWAEDT